MAPVFCDPAVGAPRRRTPPWCSTGLSRGDVVQGFVAGRRVGCSLLVAGRRVGCGLLSTIFRVLSRGDVSGAVFDVTRNIDREIAIFAKRIDAAVFQEFCSPCNCNPQLNVRNPTSVVWTKTRKALQTLFENQKPFELRIPQAGRYSHTEIRWFVS